MISTQTLTEASALFDRVLLVDQVQVLQLGAPVTSGYSVTVSQSPVGEPVAALVQTTTNAQTPARESYTETVYSVKVPAHTDLRPGQAVRVLKCEREPDLVGKVLLLDRVSLNGLALIRKAIARDFRTVQQEGKATL